MSHLMSKDQELLESPLSSRELAERYRDLCYDRRFANVPGKVELDVWGRILMTPASVFRRYGGPEVLEYGELPDPVPAAGEVLVEIHAASINAADWKMRGGHYGAKMDFPHVPGRDFSGVVIRSAGDFKPGDAVFGVCEVPREGAYAEKIAIREAIVARKPDKLSHVQCAAIALTGLTALVSLEDTLKLKRGETILIQGGAGGVGGFAVALAKHLGARVITT